jgi:hypothetical protein
VCLFFAWEKGLSITLGKGKAAAICWWVRWFVPGRLTSAPACTSARTTAGKSGRATRRCSGDNPTVVVAAISSAVEPLAVRRFTCPKRAAVQPAWARLSRSSDAVRLRSKQPGLGRLVRGEKCDMIQRCKSCESKRWGFRVGDRSRGRFATPDDVCPSTAL